jgi:hypothetical protein
VKRTHERRSLILSKEDVDTLAAELRSCADLVDQLHATYDAIEVEPIGADGLYVPRVHAVQRRGDP